MLQDNKPPLETIVNGVAIECILQDTELQKDVTYLSRIIREVSNLRLYGQLSIQSWKKYVQNIKAKIEQLPPTMQEVQNLVKQYNATFPLFQLEPVYKH